MVRLVTSKRYNFKSLRINFWKILLTVEEQVGSHRFAGKNLTVCFVSRSQIKKLNKEHRGKDTETDVLSFPCDFERGYIGEIIICYKFAEKQAWELGHSLRREISFLFLHGLLHLLGFDHQNLRDEETMFSIQRAVLDELKINRN